MKKLLLLLLLAVPLFAFSTPAEAFSSKKIGCVIQDKLAAVATDAVVNKLQCENRFAVNTDMVKLVSNLGLCKTGVIADVVCPPLVSAVVDKLNLAVPGEWGCSATSAKLLVGAALTELCRKIPVSDT